MVELRNVTKRYDGHPPVWAVKGVSLRVERGEMLAVKGPSGSGKSTLLNLIGGLDSPSDGTILIDGLDLGTLDDDRRTRLRRDEIGFVFQFFNLLPTLTAWENVAFPLHLAGLPRATSRATAADVLAKVGLHDRRNHLPDELSGGEQQRVAIARAMIANPSLILADEPTGNLDSHTGQSILALLDDLRHRAESTVVLVTHDAAAAARCTRIVHMHDGQIVSGSHEGAHVAPASSH